MSISTNFSRDNSLSTPIFKSDPATDLKFAKGDTSQKTPSSQIRNIVPLRMSNCVSETTEISLSETKSIKIYSKINQDQLNSFSKCWYIEPHDISKPNNLKTKIKSFSSTIQKIYKFENGAILVKFTIPYRKKQLRRTLKGNYSIRQVSGYNFATDSSNQQRSIATSNNLQKSHHHEEIKSVVKSSEESAQQTKTLENTIASKDHEQIEKVCGECSLVNNPDSLFCKICGLFLPKGDVKAKRDEIYMSKSFSSPLIIHENLIDFQNVNRTFIPNSVHVKYRKILIDMIKEFSQKYALANDIIETAVTYLDMFYLSENKFNSSQGKLVAITCLNIAAKFWDDRYFKLSNFHHLVKDAYSLEEMEELEEKIIEKLEWKLRIRTSVEFVHFYLSRGCIFSSDFSLITTNEELIATYLTKYSEYMAMLALNDYDFNRYPPSIIAISAIACSRKILGVKPHWKSDLEDLSQLKWSQVENCFNQLFELLEVSSPNLIYQYESLVKSK